MKCLLNWYGYQTLWYAKFDIIIKFDNCHLEKGASLLLYFEFWTLSKQYTYKLTHKHVTLTLNYLPNGIFSFSLSLAHSLLRLSFHPYLILSILFTHNWAHLVWDKTLNSYKMLILIQFESLAQNDWAPRKTEMDLANDNQNIDVTPFTVIQLADDRMACERANEINSIQTQLNGESLDFWVFCTCAQSVGRSVFWSCICFGLNSKQC